MNGKKPLMLVMEKWFLLLKGSHILLSILKDVECTDCAAGFYRKMYILDNHGQLLVSPLCSSSSNM